MLDELGAYLAANGVGTLGVDLVLGFLPDTPDQVTVLFETPGGPPSLLDAIDLRAVQVRCRAVSYQDARATAETVFGLLHGIAEQTIDGTRYVLIEAKQPPFSLGRDERQRTEMAFNLRVLRYGER